MKKVKFLFFVGLFLFLSCEGEDITRTIYIYGDGETPDGISGVVPRIEFECGSWSGRLRRAEIYLGVSSSGYLEGIEKKISVEEFAGELLAESEEEPLPIEITRTSLLSFQVNFVPFISTTAFKGNFLIVLDTEKIPLKPDEWEIIVKNQMGQLLNVVTVITGNEIIIECPPGEGTMVDCSGDNPNPLMVIEEKRIMLNWTGNCIDGLLTSASTPTMEFQPDELNAVRVSMLDPYSLSFIEIYQLFEFPFVEIQLPVSLCSQQISIQLLQYIHGAFPPFIRFDGLFGEGFLLYLDDSKWGIEGGFWDFGLIKPKCK